MRCTLRPIGGRTRRGGDVTRASGPVCARRGGRHIGGVRLAAVRRDQTHANVGTDSQITPQNVSQLHQIWQVQIPQGELEPSQPLYATGVSTPSGKRDLVIANGYRGGLYAYDAGTGQLVWQVPLLPNQCLQPNGQLCFAAGSPAIDRDTNRVYNFSPYTGTVRQFDLGTGQEITGNGWPETVSLKPTVEKQSSSLTLAEFGNTKYLYVAVAGFANDVGDYQGHLTTINLNDGSQHVFNALCSNQLVHFVTGGSPDCPQTTAGIWARSGVIPDTATGKVYATTGNGTIDPANHHWGDSVISLNPNGTGNANGDPIDSWTPANNADLEARDIDLGSAEPTLLPSIPGSRFPHLGLQAGKQGELYFLNLDNLSGQGGPGHIGGEVPWSPEPVPQGTSGGTELGWGQVLGQPVAWTDSQGRVWVFITTLYDLSYSQGGGVSGSLVLTDPVGNPYLSPQWVLRGTGASREIGPVTSSGVFFDVVDNAITAFDATTGHGLWLAPLPGPNHLQTPLVTGNRVYIADENGHLTAFSL